LTSTLDGPHRERFGDLPRGRAHTNDGGSMPRTPNYGFEKRERERAKAAKTAERQKAKEERRKKGEPEESESPQTRTSD
jgi:hypothetical protein